MARSAVQTDGIHMEGMRKVHALEIVGLLSRNKAVAGRRAEAEISPGEFGLDLRLYRAAGGLLNL